MTLFSRLLAAAAMLFTGATASAVHAAGPAPDMKDPANTIVMQLTYGRVYIQLRPDLAPKTVSRIETLTKQGFYDGTPFHRVIPGFMAQGGDPTGTGLHGSGFKLQAEFSNAHHVRGTVSMARAQDPDSADSQFFICFAPSPFLDGQYTVFGQVISGMEFVDQIKKGDQANNGVVANPDKIVWMKMAADVKD